MKILGISGSPRRNGSTTKIIKEIFKDIDPAIETELISLAGKKISPCIGCLGCAKTNTCIVKDDANDIMNKMVEADALIIGGTNIYGGLNGLTRSFLERLYSFRHNGLTPLKNKPTVSIASAGGDTASVLRDLNYFIKVHQLDLTDSMEFNGSAPCFDCGFGHTCDLSGVKHCIKDDGKLDFTMRPDIDKAPEKLKEISELRNKLSSLLLKG